MSTEFLSNNGYNEYSLREEKIHTNLDPELQNAVLLWQAKRPLPRHLRELLTSGEEVVDVIAKLRDPRVKVKGLYISQRIGQIVTGVVKAKDIIRVRKNRNVLSLKGARRLFPTLANSVPEIRATPQQLRTATGKRPEPDGTGVIVGIIDHGCDFTHNNFRTAGDTRVLFLWDQSGGTVWDLPEGFGRSPKGYNYGREFSADALNLALREACPDKDPTAPFRFLKYRIVSEDDIVNFPEHGTAVMDVAAGNGNGGGGINPPGVAPGADIIFVDSSLGEDAGSDASLGNSRHLLEAVKYVFDKARELNRPAVVNISLNYDGGPHDGSTPVEEGFDRLLETPGRAIVIAAGNSRDTKIHVRRMVHPDQPCTLFWQIREEDQTDNKLEIWYSGRQRLKVTVRPPKGVDLGPVPPATTSTILRQGREVGRIFNRIHDSANGDNQIALILDAGAEAGVWEVEVRSASSQPFPLDAWIELDDVGHSFFADAQAADQACTLGTIACGQSTLVASGYDVLDPEFILNCFAEGPTRDGKQKPEVSAPAHGLEVALALTDAVDGPVEGTSFAAPHVTGLVALLMQVATRPLTIDEIRALVMNCLRKRPPSISDAWNSRYGFGRIDAFASMKELVKKQTQRVVVIEEKEELIVGKAVAPIASDGLLEVDTAVAIESSSVTVLTATPSKSPPDNLISASAEPDEDAPLEQPETRGH